MKRILLLSSIVIFGFMGGACAPSLELEETAIVESAQEQAMEQESLDEVTALAGMIMPHHELAKDLIESAWEEALKPEPELIILIGPDHPGRASYPLIWDERTETQASFAVSPLAGEWIDDGLGGAAIAADHSIETPLKFLPDEARKIPVLALTVPRGMDAERVERLAEAIQALEDDRLLAGNCLLVGSVDFSHGLSSEASKTKDEESWNWIQNRDFDAIRIAGNEYFDSPETLEILLRCLDGELEQIARSDSADFGWGETLPGTSYQVIRVTR